MGIHVRWDDAEQTILYCEFEAEWDLNDFHKMIDDMYAFMTSVNHPVYTINDYTKSKMPPRQWLSTGRHVQQRSSINSELSIVVGANTFVKVMLNVAQKLFLNNMHIVTTDTVDEAYRLIAEKRQARAA